MHSIFCDTTAKYLIVPLFLILYWLVLQVMCRRVCVCVCACVCVCVSPCCILRCPGGERIVDIVPGGTELDFQLRRGVGQAAHTRNNPHVKCTGVYCAQTVNNADTNELY